MACELGAHKAVQKEKMDTKEYILCDAIHIKF